MQIILAVFVISFLSLANFAPVYAHCPLCVGGAAVGLSVARFLGIDDAISGVWVAALTGAVALWIDMILMRRKKNFPFSRPLIYLASFGLTIWSFYAFNDWMISNLKFYLINEHAGQIWGVDKLTFGIISGGILFYLVDVIDDLVIKKHGKVYFPYQRVVVPLSAMLLLSFGIFILINYVI